MGTFKEPTNLLLKIIAKTNSEYKFQYTKNDKLVYVLVDKIVDYTFL